MKPSRHEARIVRPRKLHRRYENRHPWDYSLTWQACFRRCGVYSSQAPSSYFDIPIRLSSSASCRTRWSYRGRKESQRVAEGKRAAQRKLETLSGTPSENQNLALTGSNFPLSKFFVRHVLAFRTLKGSNWIVVYLTSFGFNRLKHKH